MFYIFTFILAYLIAAINPAIVISKRVLKQDIRNLGSGNAGTTNTLRTLGWKAGIITFFGDCMKSVLAVLAVKATPKAMELKEEAEIEEMFKIIRDLKKKDIAMVYISHRMDEIKVITDRVTVMRDGTYVGTLIT